MPRLHLYDQAELSIPDDTPDEAELREISRQLAELAAEKLKRYQKSNPAIPQRAGVLRIYRYRGLPVYTEE